MRRLQLFELNEQPWLPGWWRDGETDFLETLFTRLGLYRAAVPYLASLLRETGSHRLVDLAAGAGGPLLALIDPLVGEVGEELEVVVTDKFPNRPAFDRLHRLSGGRIRGFEDPVDATAVPPELDGVLTLFDSFHHFSPSRASSLLAQAVEGGRAVAVFDAVDRSLPGVLSTPLIPLLVWLLTPWARPFRWNRLLFTYLIPLLPLSIFWDGLVSHLRAYRVEELVAMTRDLGGAGYRWEVGRTPARPMAITYLLGRPA